MNNHSRQTLNILQELAKLFPNADPIRVAAAFTDVSEHLVALQTIEVDIVPDSKADGNLGLDRPNALIET